MTKVTVKRDVKEDICIYMWSLYILLKTVLTNCLTFSDFYKFYSWCVIHYTCSSQIHSLFWENILIFMEILTISWMFWGDLSFCILWSPSRTLKLLLQVLCKNNVSWWKNTHCLVLAKHTPSTPITHTQPFHSVLPRVLDVSETAMSTYPQQRVC